MWWERFLHAVPPASGAAGGDCLLDLTVNLSQECTQQLVEAGHGASYESKMGHKMCMPVMHSSVSNCSEVQIYVSWCLKQDKSRVPDLDLCPLGIVCLCLSKECSYPYTTLVLWKVLFVYSGVFMTDSPSFQVVHFKWVNASFCVWKLLVATSTTAILQDLFVKHEHFIKAYLIIYNAINNVELLNGWSTIGNAEFWRKDTDVNITKKKRQKQK